VVNCDLIKLCEKGPTGWGGVFGHHPSHWGLISNLRAKKGRGKKP